MALETSYSGTPDNAPASGSFQAGDDKEQYWPLTRLRRCYQDYIFSKRDEIEEQKTARRYYHGSQWTAEQINVMKKRKQPTMTFNRVARKIDGTIGLIERLRQDPKAYARTPQHEQGADLATAALRYVLDEQEWKAKSPIVAQDGAVDGIGGIEINLTTGDHGDPEIEFDIVDIQSFFYDARSFRYDFSDARFMGIGKWVDIEVAKEMFPDAPPDAFSMSAELINNTDREMRWFATDGVNKRVRIIDLWYQHNGGWCYAIFSGNEILMEGRSFLKDEKNKEMSKYIMYSGNVDQDGDRYGFIRNMKSAQDGINAKQSKMQHILASRRLMISQGAVDDIEKTRAEWARPDGVVVTNRPVQEGIRADDQSFDFTGWVKMLELNLNEIENFGPNPALIGQGLENKSGRAIALLQQAGIAELGPYILAYRGWKIRVYRAIWNAVQNHWKGERWIRVTDSEDVAQFIQINGVQVDPQTGMPTMVNAIGSLDVDIILDESTDQVNQAADVYETIGQVLPSVAPMLNPMQAQSMIGVLIQSSPLPADVKKKFRDDTAKAAAMPPPPDPKLQALQIQAQVDQQKAQMDAQLEQQKAQQDAQLKAQIAEHDAMLAQAQAEHDIKLSQLKTQADIEAIQAKTAASMQLENHKANQQLAIRQTDHELKCKEMAMSMDMEMANNEDKAEKTEMGQIKAIADKFAETIKEISGMNPPEEKPEPPKTIKIQRDKTGRISGAVVTEAAE